VRTRVGYAGGSTPDPTYRSIGDHSETIQIDYDPTQITYSELLEVFWNSHNPRGPSISRQYASIIFYHDEGQQQLAEQSIAERTAAAGKLWTELLPAGDFYWAEDYHQKYQLRGQRDLLAELTQIYPNPQDFANSTAAARLNGYLGRNGSLEQLEAEIDSLGLSEAAQQRLRDIVSARQGTGVP
jgi:peptide-methionine (S)-S-oxide reductase